MSRDASAQQVPANLSATETLFEAVIGGQRVSRFVSGGLSHLAVETATPVRTFFAWKGKRNYEAAISAPPRVGTWSSGPTWSATTSSVSGSCFTYVSNVCSLMCRRAARAGIRQPRRARA